MRVSEIRVKQIHVNQGIGVLECAMAMVASPLVIDNHLCKAENLKV